MTTKELESKLKISEKTCIHCPTEKLAKQVLNIFNKLGLKWCNEKHYIICTNWDKHEENTLYYPFDGLYSSLKFANLTGYKIISAEEFIALHTVKEKFDLENYDPEGGLTGFPKEIIARMLECQEEQGNKRDVSVFENNRRASICYNGFYWDETKEGDSFWNEVIREKNFNLFFEKYPKKKETKICSKCHKEKSLSGFHKRGNTVRSECKECRKQEHQELKNNKNMQENNKKEEDSQEFRVGDKVYDIIRGQRGKVTNIDTHVCLPMFVNFNDNETACFTLDGRYYGTKKYPILLHYRDDYDYSVIDFNNLPKRQEVKRWRAKIGKTYYSFTSNFKIEDYCEENDFFDEEAYDSGNYFQTKKEAQEVADKLKEYFKQLINTKK